MQKPTNNNSELMQYAGLATQLLAALGLAVFIGYKGDEWLHLRLPLLVWLLPFVVLCLLIFKLIKETSKKKQDDSKK